LKTPINSETLLNFGFGKELISTGKIILRDYNSRQNVRCLVDETLDLLRGLDSSADQAVLTSPNPIERKALFETIVQESESKRRMTEAAWDKIPAML
jgi:hypothetical protein